MAMVAWFTAGADPAKLPEFQKSNDDFVGLLVIEKDGTILKYERSATPYKIEEKCYAIGSGRDYALTAMHLGYKAAEAVRIASELDCNTGRGADEMTLETPE